jgi:hypothetical protein
MLRRIPDEINVTHVAVRIEATPGPVPHIAAVGGSETSCSTASHRNSKRIGITVGYGVSEGTRGLPEPAKGARPVVRLRTPRWLDRGPCAMYRIRHARANVGSSATSDEIPMMARQRWGALPKKTSLPIRTHVHATGTDLNPWALSRELSGPCVFVSGGVKCVLYVFLERHAIDRAARWAINGISLARVVTSRGHGRYFLSR